MSFKKGCYVGQEVVSRMEHRGTARNRILPVRLDGAAPPKGTEIRAGEKQVGTLLSSAGTGALALIRLDRLAEAAAPLLGRWREAHSAEARAGLRYDVPGAEACMSALRHEDGLCRCNWCGTDPLYVAYHDTEWGVPEYDSRALFEKLLLDGFQAGLSWITILRKRDNFRARLRRLRPGEDGALHAEETRAR